MIASEEEQQEMALTLNEIIVRRHVQLSADRHFSNKNQHFLVDTPNQYENAEDAKKIVEINIIDILFDNKVSNLVYMRDITSYVNQNPDMVAQKQVEDEDLDVGQVTRSLLKSPTTYIKALSDKVNSEVSLFQI